MGGKVIETHVSSSPGPGQYVVKSESGKGVKIGKESKEGKDRTTRKDVPGPGQYD